MLGTALWIGRAVQDEPRLGDDILKVVHLVVQSTAGKVIEVLSGTI